MNTLNTVDYIIFSLMLVVSLLIGLHHALSKYYKKVFNCLNRKSAKFNLSKDDNIEITGNKHSKIGDYLIANGSMSVFPIALSLLATFYSSTALLGNPAEIYVYGTEYTICILGMMVTPIIGAFTTGPMFARLKVKSVFEYLKLRYDSELVRSLAVFCYLIRNLISSSLFIYGPATSLNLLAKIDPVNSIIIIGAIGTFYTTIGGIRAVIWTDVFQLIIMFSGLILIITKGVIDIGGFEELIEISSNGGRLNFFDFDPNPFLRQSFWSLFFGITVYFSMSYCIDQQMVQRFSSAKNVRTAQIALLLNVPGVFLLMSLCCFTGLVIYATYSDCDPLTMPNTVINNSNQILPFFVIDRLTSIKGSAGLFLSAIFAGSLSSVSSSLNSSAAILWQDFLKRFDYFKMYNDNKSTLTTKILVLICGVLATSLAFVVSTLGGNLIQMNFTLNGSFNAPIIGVFILGSLVPFTNKHGAMLGLISGFAVGLWMSLGAYIYKPLYPKLNVTIAGCNFSTVESQITTKIMDFNSRKVYGEALNLSGFNKFYSISYLWFTTIGTITTIVIGVFVSLVTGCNNKKELNPEFMLFKCLSKKKLKSVRYEMKTIETD
jgi:SSS family transporter